MNSINKYTILFFFKSFWKAILWALAIIVLSLLSGNKVNKLSPFHFQHVDKVYHFIMYFVFTYFLIDGFISFHKEKYSLKTQFLYVLTISLIFGGIMEIFQILFIINRSGEVLDFISNFTGTIIAMLLYNKLQVILIKLKIKF